MRLRIPLGFAIGIAVGSILSGIAVVFLLYQIGFFPSSGANGMAPGILEQSGFSTSQLSSMTRPTMQIQVREHLGNDSFALPPGGSRQIVFETKAADHATLLGSADITGNEGGSLKVTALDGSCPQAGCPEATIYGPAKVNLSPTGNAIYLSVPAGQTQALLFANYSDKPQTIAYHLMLEYQMTVPKS